MPVTRGHRRSKREVLGGGTRISSAGQRETQPELGVIVGWASLYDQPEVPGGRSVLAGVELRPGKRLQYAPGPRLGSRGPLEQLRGRRRTAPAEQVQAALVELMGVGTVGSHRVGVGSIL
jgi:hypothetical protein